ncbi:MAG: hypothetical protein ACLTKI_09455, partial [Lachnospiraceae bacterium]
SYLPVELFDALTIDQKQLEQSFFHDYLRNFTDRKPAYVKIYINTPHYSFLDLEPYFSPDTALLLWTTDILDENKQVIGSTITASPEGSENDSFITFSIE